MKTLFRIKDQIDYELYYGNVQDFYLQTEKKIDVATGLLNKKVIKELEHKLNKTTSSFVKIYTTKHSFSSNNKELIDKKARELMANHSVVKLKHNFSNNIDKLEAKYKKIIKSWLDRFVYMPNYIKPLYEFNMADEQYTKTTTNSTTLFLNFHTTTKNYSDTYITLNPVYFVDYLTYKDYKPSNKTFNLSYWLDHIKRQTTDTKNKLTFLYNYYIKKNFPKKFEWIKENIKKQIPYHNKYFDKDNINKPVYENNNEWLYDTSNEVFVKNVYKELIKCIEIGLDNPVEESLGYVSNIFDSLIIDNTLSKMKVVFNDKLPKIRTAVDRIKSKTYGSVANEGKTYGSVANEGKTYGSKCYQNENMMKILYKLVEWEDISLVYDIKSHLLYTKIKRWD